MNFFKYKHCSDDMGTTDIENLFLNKYMVTAPGDYVKIYLLGMQYSKRGDSKGFGKIASNEIIAKVLSIDTSIVIAGWKYWEEQGIIRIYPVEDGNEDDINIEFLSLRGIQFEEAVAVASSNKKETSVNRLTHAMENKQIRDMFEYIKQLTGKLISSTEMFIFLDWIDLYHFDPYLVVMLVEECVERGVRNINYMNKVAKTWYDNGVDTEEKALIYTTEQTSNKMFLEINKILGKNIDSSDMGSFLDWINDYHFTQELVIYLVNYCASRGKKEMAYMDAVASSWHNNGIKTVEQAVASEDIFKDKWKKYKKITDFLKCGRPTASEEDIMTTWFEKYKLDEETILLAADYIQGFRRPTISNMNSLIEKWNKENINTKAQAEVYIREHVKEIDAKKSNTNSSNKKDNKPSFNNFTNRVYDPEEMKKKLNGYNKEDINGK